jgi:hypothetical protein
MKASKGLGLVAVFEYAVCILTAIAGIPVAPIILAGFAGFFTWGTLEALDDERT